MCIRDRTKRKQPSANENYPEEDDDDDEDPDEVVKKLFLDPTASGSGGQLSAPTSSSASLSTLSVVGQQVLDAASDLVVQGCPEEVIEDINKMIQTLNPVFPSDQRDLQVSKKK